MNRNRVFWLTVFFILIAFRAMPQAFDSLQNIRIIVTFSSPPSVYSVAKAPLRFNKLFAFSFEEDDGDKDIYTYGYPLLNGGVINGTSYPGLKYTDGCGNDQKFKMGAAIFSFSLVGGLTDMHDPAGTFAVTNVTWPELTEMYLNNWNVLNHALTSGGGGTIPYEVARNHSYVKLKMQEATPGGSDMKIFVNPNGIETYSAPAWAQGYKVCYREGYSFADPSVNVSAPFPYQNIAMHRTTAYEAFNLNAYVANLAAASTGGAHHWGVAFTHALNNGQYGYSFSTFKNHMNSIAATYGKGGLDNIYMASEEEVLDYILVRDSINVNSQLNGNVLTISFSGNLNNSYRFYNSTILVSANRSITSVSTQGVQASSYNGIGTSNSMVNISWNGHYVVPPEVNAETWVSKTETTHNQEDANVAIDYILMVPPGPAQKAFRLRLCQVAGLTLPSDFCTYRNAPVATLPQKGGCPGNPLLIPVAVDSFLNITGCYLRIEYNPTVMTFVSGASGKPSVLSGMQITDQAVGGGSSLRKISISWASATPKSLAVHDTLALLSFNYISGNTAVLFNTSSNSGNDCRYIDEGGHAMYQYPPGSYFVGGLVTNSRLPAPGAISGTSSLCLGTSGNTYTIVPVAGASSYSWNFPAGFTVTQGAGNDTIVVTAGPAAVSGNITVRAVNVCSDNPLSPPFAVTMKTRPLPVISGPASICVLSSGVLYTSDAGMTDYSWTVSPGGTIMSGQGGASISVAWTVPGPQTVSVVYRGINGCMAPVPTVKNVTVNPLPVPAITGNDTVCRSTPATYSAAPGMQSYQWQISPSGTVISGAGTSTVNVRWEGTGSQWINLNTTNAFGCQAVSPVVKNVFVRQAAQPSVTGPDSLCEGAAGVIYSTQTGMNAYSWVIPSGGTIMAGAGTSAISVQWNDPGTRQVQLNYTLPGGCPAASPFVLPVNVHSRPHPVISGPDHLCTGNSGTLFYTESGMTAYQWTVSAEGVILSGAGNDSITTGWIAAGDAHVDVTYINPFGCVPVSPAVHAVRVNPLPSPSVSGPSQVCNSSTAVLYKTQPGKSNYAWTISPGGIITWGQGNDSIRVNWTATGVQQITVNYFDSNYCTASSPFVYPVVVSALPAPSVTGPVAICAGSTAVYSTQAAMSNYVWSVSSGGTIMSGQGSQAISVKWNQAGSATVAVNYANSSGCSAISPYTLNVTVNPTPAPVITGPPSACLNTTASYSTQTGMSNYSWSVTPGGTIISGGGSSSVVVNWQSSGDQTVSLSCTNAQGCQPQQPAVKAVRVHPLPQPVISGPASVCCFSTNQSYATQHGKSGYTWTVSSGGLITSGQGTDSVRVNWLSPGTRHLTVNYLDSNGCTAPQPADYTVTVHALPSPSVTGPSPVCAGSAGNTYTTQTGMGNYLWTVSSGGTILSGLGTEIIQVRWDSAGARSVTVNYSNSFGCFAQNPAVKTVTVNPLPVPTITGADSICMNATGTYTTQTGMNNYQWVISPGGYTASGIGTNTIHVTWTSPGPRTVSVNYTNGNNCTANAPTVFSVNVFPLPSPTITGSNSVCANSTGESYETETGMSGYLWTTSSAGNITAGQGTDSVTVSWGNQGTATISVTYTSPKGCAPVTPGIETITINPRPLPVITGSNQVCINSGPKTYSTLGGQQDYAWEISPGDSILSGQGTASVSAKWNSAGSHWISATFSSTAGCQALVPDTLAVTVTPLPSAATAISGPTFLCTPASWQEYSVALIANANGYYWSLPAGAVFQGSSNTNVVHVTYLPGAQSGNITVYGTNACGNGVPSSLFVDLHPVPAVPVVSLGQNNTLYSNSLHGNQWHRNNQPLAGDTLDHLPVTMTGDYYTIVTLGGCSSDTSNIKHAIAVGVDNAEAFSVIIHPNPTSGKLNIEFDMPSDKIIKLILINELGAKIYESEQHLPQGPCTWQIDISKIPPGPVFLIIQTPEGIIRDKIIKN